MEVKLANSAGFCWGVKRAIDMALELRAHSDASIQTFGPLIHNPQTLKMLESKKIEATVDLEKVEVIGNEKHNDPDLFEKEKEGYVVIRAHGIPPEERHRLKASNKKLIDATCPDVGLIHGLIRKHIRRGYHIIILGDAKHPEVIGLMGYTEGKGFVVASEEDIESLPSLPKVYVVSQSTLDGETWLALTQAIQRRWSDAEIRNTICDATTDRQSEVKQLAKEVDIMIVVGGRNSSNTRKLLKLALKCGIPAHQVETEEEIQEEWFSGLQTAGVTAGASTPNWQIMKVVEKVESIKSASQSAPQQRIQKILDSLLENHVLLSLGAMSLCYVVMLIMGGIPGPERFAVMILAGIFIDSMHTFHGSRELGTFRFQDLMNLSFYRGHRWPIFLRSGIGFFLGLILASTLSWNIFVFYTLMSFVGFAYRLQILPKSVLPKFQYRSLLAMPGSRDIFMAFAWATVIVGLPALLLLDVYSYRLLDVIKNGAQFQGRILGIVTTFLFVAAMVFIRSLVSDERDIKRDKLIGRETLPIVLGRAKTIRLLWSVLLFAGFLLVSLSLIPGGNPLGLILLPIIALTYFYVHRYHFKVQYRNVWLDLIADAKFLAMGIWVFAWIHWF